MLAKKNDEAPGPPVMAMGKALLLWQPKNLLKE